MEWRFWRRGNGKKSRKADAPAIAPSPQNSNSLFPLPAPSVKEILGLQQLIGNQAVLQLLAANRTGPDPNRTHGPEVRGR